MSTPGQAAALHRLRDHGIDIWESIEFAGPIRAFASSARSIRRPTARNRRRRRNEGASGPVETNRPSAADSLLDNRQVMLHVTGHHEGERAATRSNTWPCYCRLLRSTYCSESSSASPVRASTRRISYASDNGCAQRCPPPGRLAGCFGRCSRPLQPNVESRCTAPACIFSWPFSSSSRNSALSYPLVQNSPVTSPSSTTIRAYFAVSPTESQSPQISFFVPLPLVPLQISCLP